MKVTCQLCGFSFSTDQAYQGCQGCPLEALKGQCGFARCPRCGHDNLIQPTGWTQKLRVWLERKARGEHGDAA